MQNNNINNQKNLIQLTKRNKTNNQLFWENNSDDQMIECED